MNYFFKFFLILLFSILTGVYSYAQLSGNINVGTGETYTTLSGNGGFFSAVNSQGLSGNLTVYITSDLSENGNNSLNQWTGSYTISIVPSAAVTRTISGSDNNSIIDLNGADGLTIDGRFSGSGKYLKFVNTNTGGSTFRFINDATSNTITYCIIEGANTSTAEGTINISTTTGTTGNDNNTISYCDIRDVSASGSTPTNAIISSGSTGSAAVYNSGISILYNNIFNFYRDGQNCAGILLRNGSTSWIITGNSFYQTTSRANTSSMGWNAIYIYTTLANNITVSGNYIGGSAANCSGSAWTVSGNVSNYFYGIRFREAGTTTASNVDGNTIANFSIASTPSTANGLHFSGVYISSGLVNVGSSTGNTIGNNTSNGNISVNYSGNTNNIYTRPILHNTTGNISNNVIGSINIGSTGTGIQRFDAIAYLNTPTQAITISNNTIGSTTIPNSIQTTSNFTMVMCGIYTQVNGVDVTISGNTVSNLSNSSTNSNGRQRGIYQNTGTTGRMIISSNTVQEISGASAGVGSTNDRFPNNCAVIGIFTGSSNTTQLVTGNTINGIRNTGNSNNYVQGFAFYNSAGAGTFSKNKIYDLTTSSTSSSPKIYGINSFWGSWSTINNQITITNGETSLNRPVNSNNQVIIENVAPSTAGNTAGNIGIMETVENTEFNEKSSEFIGDAYTNSPEVKGIHEEAEFGGVYYYNSVYIGGSAVSGSSNSWAWDRPLTSWPTPVTLRNNLFINARTGGTGNHFTIGNEITPPSTNWTAASSNYNVFISSNAGTMGNWGTSTQTITAWRTSSGGDKQTWSTTSGSLSPSNLFTDISAGNLNINSSNYEAWLVSGKGLAITGQSQDFEGNSRPTTVSAGCSDIGADEFTATPPSCPASTVDNAPGSGVISTYTLWSRTISVINWGTGGSSYPTSLDIRYYSGVSNPNAVTGNFSNSYWNMTTIGELIGATYDVSIYFGDNETYTITTPSANTRLAKYDSYWYVFAVAGSGSYQSELDWANLWIKTRGPNTFSDYVLTDGSNPLPVEMCSFTASVSARSVNLNWITCSEFNNMGFDVERRNFNSATSQYNEWVKIGFVEGHGTTNQQTLYKFSDNKLVTGKYQYRLKQIDYNNNFEYHNLMNPADVIIGKPAAADLYQNYPNPSNPSSKVDFQLQTDSRVSLKVYDLTGREVAVLVNGQLEAGYYTVDFNGNNIASGIYFYRLVAESKDVKFSKTMKMVLIK